MSVVTRRRHQRRTETIGILREILSHGPLSTPQIYEVAPASRVTIFGWLQEGEKAGEIRRVTRPGQKPTVWALMAPDVVEPAPEGPRPFEDLVRKMKPGRWHTATELSAFREQLTPAVDADLLEMCRRWYMNRPGRPATLYKLTVGGELVAGREVDQWGYPLGSGWR